MSLYPWIAPDAILNPPTRPTKGQRVKPDPIARARYYQALLDSGDVESRADLARHLGVSRARVTQVLRRLVSIEED